jgi:tyrosine-specific transport protein
MNKNFIPAVAVMVGYVIGVGMFGLPFLVSKAGVVSFFLLLIVLGFAQYFVHLVYANVILSVKQLHRMPGYAGIYLGTKWKHMTFVAKLVGNLGALLAYIIITGIFLNQLLSPIFGGSEFIYASILFFIQATIIYFGIGLLSRVELLMTSFLLMVVIMLAVKGHTAIVAENFMAIDWKYLFLPYGAMLFALDGNGSLPIVANLLNRDKKAMKKVVRWGTFIPVFVIIAFTLTIVGISGENTTQDALVGISSVLGNGVVTIALIFGVLTMVTSFLGVAQSLRETLCWDYGVNKFLGWAFACFTPYFMYLLGFKNLITVVSFAGAIAGGFSAIMLILVFMKLKRKKKKLAMFKYKPSVIISVLLICMFVSGLLYEIWAFLAD